MAARGGEKTTDSQQRNSTTYCRVNKGEQTSQFKESDQFSKDQNKFVLSNKFEYGYDAMGGRKLASTDGFKKSQIEREQIAKIVGSVGQKYAEAESNKAND